MSGASAILGVIRHFAARYPWRLAAGIALVAATVAAGAGLLSAAGTMIAGAGLAGAGLILFESFGPSARIRFFAVLRTVARYGERMASHDATLRFLAELRVSAFRGLVRRFRGSERPTILFSRLTSDLDALDGVLIRLAIPVGGSLLVLAGASLVLASIDGLLAPAVVLPLALGGLAAPLAVGGRAAGAMRRKLHALDAARVRLADLDRGRASLAAAGGLAAHVAGVEAAVDRIAASDRSLARLDTLLRILAGLGTQGAVVGAAATGSSLVADGRMDGLGFAAVLLGAFALGEAIAPMRTVALDFGRWTVAARRLAPLVEAGDGSVAAAAGAKRTGAPDVRLTGVSVAEPGSTRARLDRVDLSLAAGSRTALVGPSGSGKSTLVAVIAGRLAPTSGTVTVGEDRSVVGWLGQRTELFRGTIADNLRLADPEADDRRLDAVLRAARLDVPLDRHLGDEGSGLSGGERRRLALARLMLQDPDIVLLDEPTEGLDGATAAAVFAAILDWSAGRTLLYATHRPDEAAEAETVVRVDGGRVSVPGPSPSGR